MFGIGMPEMILILAVALIVIGPKKLPDLARSLGKAMGEFKKATRDLKESMQIDSELSDLKTAFKDINNKPEKAALAPGTGAHDTIGSDKAREEDEDSSAALPGDSMDKLKTSFDKRQTNKTDTDAHATGSDAADPESPPKTEQDSKTSKG